jgi:hypothetical protein
MEERGGRQLARGQCARDQSEVQAKGREMAIQRGVEHLIRGQDGTIGTRSTYPRSRDPKSIPG